MKKQNLLKSMFLLFALIVGSTSMWGASQEWDLTTADYASATADLVTWSSTNVTFTAAKNGGTNVNNYLGGSGTYTHTRLYSKNILTFTPLNGASITSIAITLTGSTYASYITGGTKTNCTAAASDEVVTITPTTGTSACSVQLTNTIRVETVEVTYSGGSDATPATVNFTDAPNAFISVGDIYTNVISSTPAALVITYSNGGDDDIATINTETGEVTGVGEGIATITASWAEQTVSETKYAAGSKTYDLYVGKAIEDATFDFTGYQNYGSGVALTTSTSTYLAKDAYVFTAGNITITTGGDNAKYFAWYDVAEPDPNELRFYTGTYYTVAAPTGYVITKIAFTGKSNVEKMTVDTGSLTGNNTASTWTGRSQTVKFTRGSGNPGYYTITVTYEPTSVSGTISASGWNTFSSAYKLDLSTITNGVAYYASSASGSNVELTTTDAIVDAGEGLMIKGEPGEEFTINTTTTDVSFVETNLLVGAPSGTTVSAPGAGDGYNYVFGWPNADPTNYGFYKIGSNSATLGAGKSYLHTDAELTGARVNIIFDDETTGIKNLTSTLSEKEGVTYNLAGQRVNASHKGIVIVNGKKYLNK